MEFLSTYGKRFWIYILFLRFTPGGVVRNSCVLSPILEMKIVEGMRKDFPFIYIPKEKRLINRVVLARKSNVLLFLSIFFSLLFFVFFK